MSINSIGILGGTFNPIHNQHIQLARCAYEQLSLESVLLMPSGVSYLKKSSEVLPAGIRYEMCSLAAEDEPFLKVSDIETKRSGNTYTCDTLKALLEQDPGLTYYFIIGADTLFMLDQWKNPEYIFAHCVIAVAARADQKEHSDIGLVRRIREYEGKYNAAVRLLDINISDLSSSTVREMAREGRDLRKFVPSKVAEYIKKNGLYR